MSRIRLRKGRPTFSIFGFFNVLTEHLQKKVSMYQFIGRLFELIFISKKVSKSDNDLKTLFINFLFMLILSNFIDKTLTFFHKFCCGVQFFIKVFSIFTNYGFFQKFINRHLLFFTQLTCSRADIPTVVIQGFKTTIFIF